MSGADWQEGKEGKTRGSAAVALRGASRAGRRCRVRLDRNDGIVGTRQRLAEIEERRHAPTALNRQEFFANPVRLHANPLAIDTGAARSRAPEKPGTDGPCADVRRHLARKSVRYEFGLPPMQL